jgi:hypothetical protein
MRPIMVRKKRRVVRKMPLRVGAPPGVKKVTK